MDSVLRWIPCCGGPFLATPVLTSIGKRRLTTIVVREQWEVTSKALKLLPGVGTSAAVEVLRQTEISAVKLRGFGRTGDALPYVYLPWALGAFLMLRGHFVSGDVDSAIRDKALLTPPGHVAC